jgi:hypothetical protein
MDWAFLRIERASSTLDASLSELHPGIDYRKVTAQYFESVARRRAAAVMGVLGARRTLSAVANAPEVQARLRDYMLFQGEAIRRHVQVFRAATNRFAERIAAVLAVVQTGVVVQAFVAIVLALVPAGTLGPSASIVVRAARGLPRLDWSTVAIVLLIDGRLWYVLSRVRRQLREPEGSVHQRVMATV